MSYNIDSVTEVVLDAWISAGNVVKLRMKLKDSLPESNFLSRMTKRAKLACAEGRNEEKIAIRKFDWSGEFSGSSYKDVLIAQIAPCIMGNIEAIVTWEGGDSVTGLLVRDGKAAECEVEQRVVRPADWEVGS